MNISQLNLGEIEFRHDIVIHDLIGQVDQTTTHCV